VLDESYNMTDEVTVHVVAAVVNPRLKVLDLLIPSAYKFTV